MSMSVETGIDHKEKRAFQDVQILGPFFILCTFALSPTHWFMLSAGLIGLILCAYQKMRGFVVSLVCLALAGGIEHTLTVGHHGWLIGLETSYAMAFLITALSAERMDAVFAAMDGRFLARNQFLADLEEEFQKSREFLTAQHVAAQEKIAQLQKELEEGESDKNSLLMLNEVLRKTSAQESSAKEHLKTLYEREKAQQQELFQTIAKLQEELRQQAETPSDRSLEMEELAHTIAKLQEELALQKQKEASLVDTIAKQQAETPSDRSLEMEELVHTIVKLQEELALQKQKEASLVDTIAKQQAETPSDRSLEIEELAHTIAKLQEELALQKQKEASLVDTIAKQQAETPSDRSLEMEELAHTIAKLQEELALQKQKEASLVDTIAKQQEELTSHKKEAKPQIEYLYKQLRQQFEEKNRVLHEVRSLAFHQDTQFQVKQIEKSRQEEEQDVSISSQEAASLTDQLMLLEKENQTLEELVSTLLFSSSRKKKDE